jgi:CRISPR-associated protein Cas5t
VTAPETAVLYQQLHAYPVGNSSKQFAANTHGAKYHIAPARREVLVGLNVVVGVEAVDPGLLERIAHGLNGTLDEARYGLPFAGDNNLLFDRIDVVPASTLAARWYTAVTPDIPRRGSCRLSSDIDRSDSSRSRSVLVAPLEHPQRTPPDDAWLWTPRPPAA